MTVPRCHVIVCRTKEDELEEAQLREELKAIDAALKKNKKVDAHILTYGQSEPCLNRVCYIMSCV